MNQHLNFTAIYQRFFRKSPALLKPLVALLAILCATGAAAKMYQPITKADFWIKRLNNPDEVVLDNERIKALNNAILASDDQMADMELFRSSIPKETLQEWLLEDPLPRDKTMFDRKGKKIQEPFYEKITDNMNFEGLGESHEAIFGVVVKRTDIRSFPTHETAFKAPSAMEFDAFQYSALYPPQPVALLHVSKDNQWGFFQTGFVRGWIKLDAVAFVKTRNELKESFEKFLVVTGSRVTILAEPNNKHPLEVVPMGTRLSLSGEEKNFWIVRFPRKDKAGNLEWIDAFVSRHADVVSGYLPYTKRNVLRQAFKLLGERYGWGGINGLRDCSSLIQDVFATMGINLPRHSGRQASVGTVLAYYDESPNTEVIRKAMDSAIPGITLFGLKGHIMLYLGAIDGNYFTLHQFYGYVDKDGFKTINKAVVTNLELGNGSKWGAIKDRIKSVNLLTLETAD